MNKSKHYIATLVGAIVLVSAFTASPRGPRYSDWSAPINLGPNVNSTAMDRAPAISKDGLSLYFASSNRPDVGSGGEDIYVSQRETRDSEWGPAINLGSIINTIDNEMGPAFSRDGSFGPAVMVLELSGLGNTRRPSVRHDGLEIFFGSERAGIPNSQDLWVATRETVFDAWSAPINLGSPLNSELVDVQPYISSDRETLFFASNRPSGGPTDIYMSTRTKLSGK